MREDILPIEFPGTYESVYAGFWSRLGAFLLDGLITAPFTLGVYYINSVARLNNIYTFLPLQVFYFFYFVYFVKLCGATPGKLIVGLKIIRKDGIPVDWSEAIFRHIIDLVLRLSYSIAIIISLLNMTDTEFSSKGFIERGVLIHQLLPFWYKFVDWAGDIWIWSEFIVLLLNKRKRALHDYVAGTVVIKKEYENLAKQWHAESLRQ
jgi:uncharacterized RDD family membrane protein YckC